MSQHDYNLANGSGLSIRTDLNAVLSAIVTQNSGVSEPTPTYPLQWWADTLTGYLKQRNSANDAWLIKWDLTKGQLATLYSPTFGGLVNLPATTYINGNAVATLVAPNFSGISVFEKLTAWSDVSLPASTTIGGVSATELSYLDGVTSSIQSQLNALSTNKQATLVSGTNIKTVNGNSLVGSGNVVITQNPSSVFSNSQTFTASGTFTVPAGVTKIMAYGAGGGGGGGGGRGSSAGGGAGGVGGDTYFGAYRFISLSGGAGGGGNSTVGAGAGGSGGGGATGGAGGAAGANGSPPLKPSGVFYTTPSGGGLSNLSIIGSGGVGGTSDITNGSSGANAGGLNNGGGGGGGASIFSPPQLMGVTPGQNIIVTIGAGGSGGAGGAASAGAGGAGGAGKVIVYW